MVGSSFRSYLPHFLASTVLILGGMFAYLVFVQTKSNLHKTSNEEMELALYLADKEFSQDMERAIAVTRATAALFKTDTETSAENYHQFLSNLTHEYMSEGLQAVAWVPYLTKDEKQDFERQINKDTGRYQQLYPSQYKIISPKISQENLLAPITLIEPDIYKSKVTGLNLLANPELRSLLENAATQPEALEIRSLDKPTFLNLIGTDTGTTEDQKHLTLIVLPLAGSALYQGAPKDLHGFIIGFYLIDKYATNLLPPQTEDRLKLALYSINPIDQSETLLYQHDVKESAEYSTEILASKSHVTTIGNQSWRLNIGIATPKMTSILPLPFAILLCTIALAILVSWLIFRIGRQSQILEKRVFERSSELMILNKHLEKSKQEADSANIAKSQFLANMSHELRTPLNAIIGFVQMILEGYYGTIPNNKQQEALTNIKNSGEELLSLVNNILDHTKLEVGSFHIELEALDPKEAIQSVLTKMRRQAELKKIQLSINIPENMPCVWADSLALRQILSNLIDNSIKFTKTGGAISLQVSENLDSKMVEFHVVDNGKGVTQSEANRIFDPFIQAENTMTKYHEGAGLGLSIVRQLVKSMDGHIRLKSRLGHGTTITFRLPIAKDSSSLSETSQQAIVEAS